MVKNYINKHGKRPSQHSKDSEIKQLGVWLVANTSMYKNNNMKKSCTSKWVDFINHDRYKQFFVSKITKWLDMFGEVMKYLDENKERPSGSSIDENIRKMGCWICTQ